MKRKKLLIVGTVLSLLLALLCGFSYINNNENKEIKKEISKIETIINKKNITKEDVNYMTKLQDRNWDVISSEKQIDEGFMHLTLKENDIIRNILLYEDSHKESFKNEANIIINEVKK